MTENVDVAIKATIVAALDKDGKHHEGKVGVGTAYGVVGPDDGYNSRSDGVYVALYHHPKGDRWGDGHVHTVLHFSPKKARKIAKALRRAADAAS